MQLVPLTFRRAFDQYHLPLLIAGKAAPNTIYTYRYAVKSWEAHGEANLDLRHVRQSHLLAYRSNLLATGGQATSFYSRWACLRAILSTVVCEGLVEQVPRTPRIRREPIEQKGRPSPDEVCRILAACDVADWPKRFRWRPLRVRPGTIWRSLYAVAYLTALRRSDLVRLEWSHWTGDGIRITPRKTRRYRKTIWCPDVGGALSAAMAPMRGADLVRVFPSGFRGDLVAEQQRKIAARAGVRIERAGFQAFRRASLDAWCGADERAPELIAGHGLRMARITRTSYVSLERQESRAACIMREAADRFPLPRDFLALLNH